MAVYCGVCATRLWDASENGGQFLTTDFGGWDERSRAVIRDTCEPCAAILAQAVGQAAKRICEEHSARVEELRKAASKTG
jgi:ribosomal protein S27E